MSPEEELKLYCDKDFLREDYDIDFIPAWPVIQALICKHCGKMIDTGFCSMADHLYKDCQNYKRPEMKFTITMKEFEDAIKNYH